MTIANGTFVSGMQYKHTADAQMPVNPVGSRKDADQLGPAAEYTPSDVVRGNILNVSDLTSEIQSDITSAQDRDRAIGSLAEIMQKMNALAAQSMRSDLDATDRKSIKADMMELRSLLTEVQNADNGYDVSRRLNKITVSDVDMQAEEDALSMIGASVLNILDQAGQAMQAQANMSGQVVLALV